ncbi:MAG: hypothetical protein FWC01_07810 [Treponema sp.]|nr:hypothetical protein [Treponema sp.]MCL2237917.1 hypothetical protein [Treponema sp.]
MKIKYINILLIVAVLVVGCAKPPEAEMAAAREAVFKAENDSNAVEFGGASLARARASLRLMQEEADAKRYDSAKTHAADAITAANRAVADGRANSQRAVTETDSLISTLRIEIEEATRNVNGARYSNLRLDYDALDRALADAHNTTDQAAQDQAEGRSQQALDRARIVRSNLSEINQMVASAAPARKK